MCSLLILSCENAPQKEESTETNTETSSTIDESKIGRTNYAVIWKWTTDDVDLVSNNTVQISNELTSYWKQDIVENAYYNADSKIDKLEYFPNIVFFLKAQTEEEAKELLDTLTIVQQGIASYELKPVGMLWMDRKTDVINKKGMTKSFAAVWTTENKDKLTDNITKSQAGKIVELWNNGTIENVYFDVEGTNTTNQNADFVFFVNANSESDAEAVCKSLPVFTEGIATYKLHEAGVFWMGKYED